MKKLLIFVCFSALFLCTEKTFCMDNASSEVGAKPGKVIFSVVCCKTVSELEKINEKAFEEILDLAVKNQLCYLQKQYNLTKEELDLEDFFIRAHSMSIYKDFQEKKLQAMVYRHIKGNHNIVFFKFDESYNSVILSGHISVKDDLVECENDFYFINQRILCSFPKSEKTIISVQKNLLWTIDLVKSWGFSECAYTGDQIDLEENIVLEKKIAVPRRFPFR